MDNMFRAEANQNLANEEGSDMDHPLKNNMIVSNSFQLAKFIQKRENIRTENVKTGSQVFRNKDDELAITEMDMLLTEQKEMLADRSN